MAKKTIDVEIAEAQEELDNLKADERTQRTLNDTLNKDNRELKKENKAMGEEKTDVSAEIKKLRATLKTLRSNESDRKKEVAEEKASISKLKKEAEIAEGNAEVRIAEAGTAENKANAAKKIVTDQRAMLQKEVSDFAKDQREVEALKAK